MKPTVISHPFRNIVLEYESESAFSALERRGLEAYRYLHDLTFQLRQSVLTLHDFYTGAASTLIERKTRFRYIEDACIPLHGYFRQIAGLSGSNWKEPYRVKARIMPVVGSYHAFYEAYLPFFHAIMEKDNEYDAMRRLLQHTEEELHHFTRHHFHAITRHPEDPHIDAGSLYRDFDDFKRAFTIIQDMEGRLVSLRNGIVEDLKTFVVKVNNVARLLQVAKEQYTCTKADLN